MKSYGTLCIQRCPQTYTFSSYAISDLHSFKEVKTLEISVEFFLVGIKVQSDKGGGRILLGDNTGGRVVMLQLIRFHYVGVWMPAGQPCIYTYNLPYVYSVLTCTNSNCTGNSGPCLYCKSQDVTVIYHTNFMARGCYMPPNFQAGGSILVGYLLRIHFVFLNRLTFQSQYIVKLKNVSCKYQFSF